jgi:hypothetical protein
MQAFGARQSVSLITLDDLTLGVARTEAFRSLNGSARVVPSTAWLALLEAVQHVIQRVVRGAEDLPARHHRFGGLGNLGLGDTPACKSSSHRKRQ